MNICGQLGVRQTRAEAIVVGLTYQRPIDGSAADLKRLRDGGRPHAIGFHLLDLGRIDARLAPLVDAARLRNPLFL